MQGAIAELQGLFNLFLLFQGLVSRKCFFQACDLRQCENRPTQNCARKCAQQKMRPAIERLAGPWGVSASRHATASESAEGMTYQRCYDYLSFLVSHQIVEPISDAGKCQSHSYRAISSLQVHIQGWPSPRAGPHERHLFMVLTSHSTSRGIPTLSSNAWPSLKVISLLLSLALAAVSEGIFLTLRIFDMQEPVP